MHYLILILQRNFTKKYTHIKVALDAKCTLTRKLLEIKRQKQVKQQNADILFKF